MQYPPLCKEIFCFISFTVPVFPIQGLECTTAVESRALEENLFLRRAGSPGLSTAHHSIPPSCCSPISFPLSILLPRPSKSHQLLLPQKKSEAIWDKPKPLADKVSREDRKPPQSTFQCNKANILSQAPKRKGELNLQRRR